MESTLAYTETKRNDVGDHVICLENWSFGCSTALPNKSDMQSCEKINILIISLHFLCYG